MNVSLLQHQLVDLNAIKKVSMKGSDIHVNTVSILRHRKGTLGDIRRRNIINWLDVVWLWHSLRSWLQSILKKVAIFTVSIFFSFDFPDFFLQICTIYEKLSLSQLLIYGMLILAKFMKMCKYTFFVMKIHKLLIFVFFETFPFLIYYYFQRRWLEISKRRWCLLKRNVEGWTWRRNWLRKKILYAQQMVRNNYKIFNSYISSQ